MKKRYMTQQYFDMLAVAIAQVAVYDGKNEHDTFSEMIPNLRHTYDDPIEPDEVVFAASKIRGIIKEFIPGEECSANFTQLKFCITFYEPDGKKRKKRLFGGTKFVYEKAELKDKSNACIRNATCYMLNTFSGKIPFAPDGWSP